jgi:hypothetical protein
VNLLSCGPEVVQLGRQCLDSRFTAAGQPSLDPFISREIFQKIPLPNNFDVGDGLNTGGLRFNARSVTAEHLPAIRLDHRISDRHSFYGSFNYTDRQIDGDYINDREPRFAAFDPLGSRVTHSRSWSATVASLLKPTLVNEARFGLIGGENAFLINQPFSTPYVLDLPAITNPYDFTNGDEVRDNRTIHLRDTVSWIAGRHSLKLGAEWRQRYVDTYDFDGAFDFGAIGFDDDDNPPGFSVTDLQRVSGGRSINSNDSELARDLMNTLTGAIGEVFKRYNVSSLTSGFVPGYPTRRKYKNKEFDWFVNDSWQAASNFTLNLGVRWEYATIPDEIQGLALMPEGGLSSVFGVSGPGGFFNPGTLNGTPCAILAALPLPPTEANTTRLLSECTTQYVPSGATNGRPFWDNDTNNFGPVISFAWDPFKDGKTSVRGGFRISYIQDHFNIVDANLDDNEGLQVTQSCIPVDGSCQSNPHLLRDVSAPPVAASPTFRLPASRSILDSATIDFRVFDRNLATPYYNEWTFGISRDLGRNWALEARYVGNAGVGLRRVADYNEINVNARDAVTGQTFLDSFRLAQRNLDCNNRSGFGGRFDDATGASCITPNPLMSALIAPDAARLYNRAGLVTALEQNATGQFVHRLTQVETSRPSANQALIRGGAFWGQVLSGRFPVNFFQANPMVSSARAMINDGRSRYHALEVETRRRFVSGFSVQANYAFGKAVTDFDGDENTLVNDTRPSSVRFPLYSRQEVAPRHQFNANWVYELPAGSGKRFLADPGIARAILGDWQLGGLMNVRSGRPISLTSGVGTFHRSDVSDDNTVDLSQPLTRGDIRELTGTRNIGNGLFYFDPCLSAFLNASCLDGASPQGLFTLPQAGSLGQLGFTPIYGPFRVVVDMSLMKRARLSEGKAIEFRWEVFNVLNRANFNVPTTSITSSNFGQITRTISTPRLMQFALKLNF